MIATKPELVFDQKRHIYYLNGVRVASVTQILKCISKPGLVDWMVRVGKDEAERIRKETSGFGTAVHAACEVIGRGDPYIPLEAWEDSVQPYVAAYTAWLDQNVKAVINVEAILGSQTFQYAGTADLIAEMQDGSIAVIDLKTSSGVDETFGAQLSAYAHALEEQEGITATRRIVVQMPRKTPGKLNVHEFHDHTNDWRAFLAASILFERYFKAEAFAPKRNILGRTP